MHIGVLGYMSHQNYREIVTVFVRSPDSSSQKLISCRSDKSTVVQVRNIFQLYADIEHTSRNNAFYEKYNLRYSMGDLLRKCRFAIPLPHANRRNAGMEVYTVV